ncbi:MAG TPA: DUF2027 domain-containing protein [Bacteroidia bacterium]|jgi:hypothetical protein|nr:DUF2027 domain-containing protein [Bacteroidia bacterium]
MKLNKGDKVRFLNEKGEGVITRIINPTTAMVEIEDGFEYEYPLNQLVPAEPINTAVSLKREDGTRKTEDRKEDVEKHDEKRVNYPEGIYLAFIPKNQQFPSAGKIDLVLFNNSSYDIYFTLSLKDGREWMCMESGAMRPYTEFEIETLTPQQIDEWGQLKTDALFFSGDSYQHRDPVSTVLKMAGVKFFKDSTFRENGLTEGIAWIADVVVLEEENIVETKPLTNADIQRMLKEKEQKISSSKVSIPHQKNQLSEKEVDLHIEELLDNWNGMTNAQLIDVQLKRVQQELDEAIANKLQRIIFIHGVGNGRLKTEVRRILSAQKGIRFHDASFQRYGFGATEVELY